jgi:hypothetical protein
MNRKPTPAFSASSGWVSLQGSFYTLLGANTILIIAFAPFRVYLFQKRNNHTLSGIF